MKHDKVRRSHTGDGLVMVWCACGHSIFCERVSFNCCKRETCKRCRFTQYKSIIWPKIFFWAFKNYESFFYLIFLFYQQMLAIMHCFFPIINYFRKFKSIKLKYMQNIDLIFVHKHV